MNTFQRMVVLYQELANGKKLQILNSSKEWVDLTINEYTTLYVDETYRVKLDLADLVQSVKEVLSSQPMYLPDFLNFIANRLVKVYGESEDTDFVQSLRTHALNLNKLKDMIC